MPRPAPPRLRPAGDEVQLAVLVGGGVGPLVGRLELGELGALRGHAHPGRLVAEVDLVAVPAQLPPHDDRDDGALRRGGAGRDDGGAERARDARHGPRVGARVEDLERPGDLHLRVRGDRVHRSRLAPDGVPGVVGRGVRVGRGERGRRVLGRVVLGGGSHRRRGRGPVGVRVEDGILAVGRVVVPVRHGRRGPRPAVGPRAALRRGIALGALAALAQTLQEGAPALGAPARRDVVQALADPALVHGAPGAQLAHGPARAAHQEDVRVLPPQQRAPADVARHDGHVGGDGLAGHAADEGSNGPMPARIRRRPPPPAG
ncbi:MAG: hypothetical protein AVDCRST_MAG13-116 [uncultured Solirubrobacteraceae bacterium]|uniref:Uncharacterized protein n=1 Tax=uncultured Solirubrobacteraceae bacterium TaxID=1162706 RepID=A0A6J4R817_9ACTN|nr:MAG: hypothetical protein AVDCRST_MAG13-116 [uncultured Solirubrobacteraceae bacterium]